ncbi:MAG: hypothetical protein LH630_03350 [Actinomycetia bacterium]|nr:hypothetical protein [Actinomycetes bacterium]
MTTDAEAALADARARVLHDLSATLPTTPAVIDALDAAISDRREWVEPWPAGASYLACLVAQDVQEAIAPSVGRWPRCRINGDHTLHIEPDLGEDPRWVCEDCSGVVAAVGEL